MVGGYFEASLARPVPGFMDTQSAVGELWGVAGRPACQHAAGNPTCQVSFAKPIKPEPGATPDQACDSPDRIARHFSNGDPFADAHSSLIYLRFSNRAA